MSRENSPWRLLFHCLSGGGVAISTSLQAQDAPDRLCISSQEQSNILLCYILVENKFLSAWTPNNQWKLDTLARVWQKTHSSSLFLALQPCLLQFCYHLQLSAQLEFFFNFIIDIFTTVYFSACARRGCLSSIIKKTPHPYAHTLYIQYRHTNQSAHTHTHII